MNPLGPARLRADHLPPVPSPAPAAPPAPYAPENEVHLLDRLAVLYRYRRISLAVFALTTATMMIQGFTNTPIYQTRAQLEIQDERSTAIPGLSNVSSLRIFRASSVDPKNFLLIGTIGSNLNTYVDPDLMPNRTYC